MGKRANADTAAVRAERKRVRQQLGPLAQLQVGVSGQKRYVRAMFAFLQWCWISYAFLPETYEQLDDLFFEFICCAWSEGEPVSLVQDGLSGLQWFLRRRRILSGSWRLLGVWQRNETPWRAPPVTIEILFAMLGLCLFFNEIELVCYLSLSFHCLLRTEEGLQVLVSHLVPSRNKMRLRLKGKSENRFGTTDDVVVEDEIVLFLLRFIMRGKQRGDKIYSDSGWIFRRKWAWLVKALLLGSDYKPYGLRRGGATFEWTCNNNAGRLCIKGRWKQLSTARIYAVQGQELLRNAQLGGESLQRIHWWAAQLQGLLRKIK